MAGQGPPGSDGQGPRLTPRSSRLTPRSSRQTPRSSRQTPRFSRLTPGSSRQTPHSSPYPAPAILPERPPPGLRERKCEAIAFVLAQMAEGARGRSPPPVCSQKARSGPGQAAKTDQQSTGAHSEWTARDGPAPGWHALAAPGHHRGDHPVVKRRSARLSVSSRARAAITRADLNPERTFGPTARSARLPVSCRARAAITRADLNRSARSARLPVSSRARAAITRADLNRSARSARLPVSSRARAAITRADGRRQTGGRPSRCGSAGDLLGWESWNRAGLSSVRPGYRPQLKAE